MYSDYISDKDGHTSTNKEPSRVLEFIRSPDDFYAWFEFVIDQIYGQGLDMSDEQIDEVQEFEGAITSPPNTQGEKPPMPPPSQPVEDTPEDTELGETARRRL